MFRQLVLGTALVALAACASNSSRLEMAQTSSTLSLRSSVSSAMVRTVSLPTYAAAEELSFETPEGLITANETVLWADDPARAVTLSLTQSLADILSTDVGPDPWPFVGLPDVAIDVRVSRMITASSGNFELQGQYFIGGDGIDYPRISESFSYSKPVTIEGPAGVAKAQSLALIALAEDIARKIGR